MTKYFINPFQVEMKGKGKLTTYWLLREETCHNKIGMDPV